jgi:hypothetical protein
LRAPIDGDHPFQAIANARSAPISVQRDVLRDLVVEVSKAVMDLRLRNVAYAAALDIDAGEVDTPW